MSNPASINTRIVEALYCEALVLSEEVRAAFAPAAQPADHAVDEDLARVALSAEGLRTTTRMMHATAWLLNHRARLRGEISDLQPRRQGRLSPATVQGEPALADLLPPGAALVAEATRHFCERLLRLDRAWQMACPAATGAIARLHERLAAQQATRGAV
ncbi:DUF1465 family protein [Novosphingobium gossypii]|uniref:DUF1465 family protein n=1 Tax=Novosphingobium gossypii TaxID=1604774 RepID=UPI003D1D3E73